MVFLARFDVAAGGGSGCYHLSSMDTKVGYLPLYVRLRMPCTNTCSVCAGMFLRGSTSVESTPDYVATAKVASGYGQSS